jgi:uncharacterized protein (DUF488 family)
MFDGPVGKTRFQKLLLLLTRMQEKPDYHFVPYKYGCFSFQATADVSTLQKYEQVSVNNLGIVKVDKEDYISQLRDKDKIALNQLYQLHGKKDYSELIRYTYTHYPFFAINSEIAGRYLNNDELQNVQYCKPTGEKTILFTIGYEGISLEEYLTKLIINDVKVLIDVRNNPISMKYGFSKNQLQNACKSVSMDYIHIPEVGIVSEQRQALNSQKDYDLLFNRYRSEKLPQTQKEQKHILSLLKSKKRIALTCFEANICQCHRKHLAEAITLLEGYEYELMHL